MMVDTWIWIGLLCIVVGLSIPQKKTGNVSVRRRPAANPRQAEIAVTQPQLVRPVPTPGFRQIEPTSTGFVLPDPRIRRPAYVSDEFLSLFDHRLDSISDQDAYYQYLRKNSRVLDSIGYTLSDEQVRADMQAILNSPLHDRAKDALLEVLTTDAENHGELCSRVPSEIRTAQYGLIKKYQSEESSHG